MLRSVFSEMTDVVKNLVLLNVVMFVLKVAFPVVNTYLVTYNVFSSYFEPYQIISHFFMHADVFHILFNLMWLGFIGSRLEKVWGAKRFLFFYLYCGIGAWLVSSLVNEIDFYMSYGDWAMNVANDVREESFNLVEGKSYRADYVYFYQYNFYHSLGASGAVSGVIVAYAYLFPNTIISLGYIPPLKMKHFAMIIIGLDLFLGVSNFSWDHVGHYAHLGGALFGIILVLIWQRDKTRMY